MMSADPFVPDPLNGQAWNRYAYVINNPLSITDPNGYCFLGLCSFFRFFGARRSAPSTTPASGCCWRHSNRQRASRGGADSRYFPSDPLYSVPK
jgi:hypothetical protein